MGDKLIRSLATRHNTDGVQFRLLMVDATQACDLARVMHSLKPMGTLALSRALCGGLLLGALAKSERNVNLQVAGDGPLGNIFVDAEPTTGRVRGYVQNNPDNPLRFGGVRPSLGLGLGQNGYVNVLRADPMGNYFRGTVLLQTGEVDDDVAEYLKSSEQVESAIALDVVLDEQNHVVRAVGVLVQALPNDTGVSLDWAREKLRSRHLYKLINKHGEAWVQPVLDWLELNTEALTEGPVDYACNCSEKRVAAALMGMGPAELSDMIEKEGKAEIKCDFCRREFKFDRAQLTKMRDLAVSVALSSDTPSDTKN